MPASPTPPADRAAAFLTARRQLGLIAGLQVLALATWFSASAVVPVLRVEWELGTASATFLTAAVQLGFVVGAVGSAALNLADRVPAHRLAAASALLAAVATAAIAALATGPELAIPLRFLTGMALAGVYPVGMKLMTSWFQRGRGFALGVLVGALTLGSALPQLINSIATLPWRGVLLVAASLAAAAAVLAWTLIRPGPHARPAPPLAPGFVITVFREPGPRLANLGYFGHMWELYAMWTWLPGFLAASLAVRGLDADRTTVGLTSFAVIGLAGLVGCLGGGWLGDRLGRARVAGWAMRGSAACCLLAALVFGAHPLLVVPVLLAWGLTVIADSGLFSSCVADVVDPRYTGTALTTQTAIGFLLSIATINAVPYVVDATSWRVATAMLALGPAVGAIAMARLDTLMRGPGLAPAGSDESPHEQGGSEQD